MYFHFNKQVTNTMIFELDSKLQSPKESYIYIYIYAYDYGHIYTMDIYHIYIYA